MGELIDFPVGDGLVFGHLARPASGARGVLVLHAWWGLTPHIKDVVERLAAAGFLALAPDLWDGVVAETADEASRRFLGLSPEAATAKLHGAIAALRREGAAGPLGVLGFGMGGALALLATGDAPDAIGACVTFYGVHPAIAPDLARLRAPVLGVYGRQDVYVSPEAATDLQARLAAHGGRMDVQLYEAGHAFFDDTHPERHHTEAAHDAWARTLAFLAAHL